MPNNQIIKSMVINALFIALVAIMSFVPYIGYISIGSTLSFTTIHAVVIFAAAFFGIKESFITSLAFGLFSLIKAACMPGSIADVDFINPFISILPRILFGLLSGFSFYFVKKAPNNKVKIFFLFLLPPLLTLFHSFITLTIYYIVTVLIEHKYTTGYLALIGSIFTLNGLVEILIAEVIVPTLVLSLIKPLANLTTFKLKTNSTNNNSN